MLHTNVYSNALETDSITEASTMKADQTEPSDLGPYYFQYMLPKCINRRAGRRQLPFILGKRLRFIGEWFSHFTTDEPVHEISNNVVCTTSKASNWPTHMRSLIGAFACRLNIL